MFLVNSAPLSDSNRGQPQDDDESGDEDENESGSQSASGSPRRLPKSSLGKRKANHLPQRRLKRAYPC